MILFSKWFSVAGSTRVMRRICLQETVLKGQFRHYSLPSVINLCNFCSYQTATLSAKKSEVLHLEGQAGHWRLQFQNPPHTNIISRFHSEWRFIQERPFFLYILIYEALFDSISRDSNLGRRAACSLMVCFGCYQGISVTRRRKAFAERPSLLRLPSCQSFLNTNMERLNSQLSLSSHVC